MLLAQLRWFYWSKINSHTIRTYLLCETRSIPIYYLTFSLFNSLISDNMIASISLFHFSTYPSHVTVLHNLGILWIWFLSHITLSIVQHCSASQISNLSTGSFSGYLRIKLGLQFGINYFKSSFLHIILFCPGSDFIIICFHCSPWTILDHFMPLFPCPHTNNTVLQYHSIRELTFYPVLRPDNTVIAKRRVKNTASLYVYVFTC